MRKFLQPLLFLMGTTIFAQAPTNGLVAYYGFESNIDSHDAQNNFTAASNNSSTISYVAGKRGDGIAFGGQNGIINTTLSNTLSPATNSYSSSPFTLSFWARESTASQGSYASFFELYGSYLLRFQSGVLHSELNSNAGYLTKDYGNVTPDINIWRHYIVRYDPNFSEAFRLYVNGIDYGNIPVNPGTALKKVVSQFIFGNGMTGTSYFHALKGYQGTIDELFVYNRALTASEVSNLYSRSLTKPTI